MENKNKPLKRLTKSLQYKAGRDSSGKVAVRNRGGRHKRKYRTIDFKRDKYDIPARVESIEYDPYRGADIALLVYQDGEKRYILAPDQLEEESTIKAGGKVELKIGNALPIGNIPVGTFVHNVELEPGAGGKLARGAGSHALIAAREGKYVRIKLPSSEVRLIHEKCYATIGQLSNIDRKHEKLVKAGRKRYLGFRPKVRGVAMDPGSHPHGGGEGRSGIGMKSPKSPWGKRTLGKKTRSIKKKNRFIVQRRK